MTTTSSTDPAVAAAPRRRRRPSWRLVVVAVVVLAVIAVAAALALRKSALLDGPIGNDEVFSIGGSVQFGKRAATGAPTAYNYGDEEAVLERIDLVDPPPGIEVVETHVAGPGRRYIPVMKAWPSREFRDLHPVDGYRLAPADSEAGRLGVALVFIMNVTRPGRHAVRAVDVSYHIGGTRYRARIRNAFAVCSYTGPARVVECASPRDY